MKNNFIKKINLLENAVLIETILILFLLASFLIMDYFIFWPPTLNHFLREKNILQQKQTELIKKQLQLIHEKKTLSDLQQWKNNDPNFYTVASSISNTNQQLSLLTNLIQQAHFTIIQLSKINMLSHSKTDCTLTLTATGQFIDLFSLMTTLNHFAIPLTLSELSIDHHQFKMTFVLRGCHA